MTLTTVSNVFLVNISPKPFDVTHFQILQVHRSHMKRILGNVLSDLDPKIKCIFLVNISLKRLTRSNFRLCRSHDVAVTGQHRVTLTPRSNDVFSGKNIF